MSNEKLPVDPSASVSTEALPNNFERAIALCRALAAYPTPSIQPEGEVAIGLDWDEGAARVLSITIDERPEIGYAYLVGNSRAHGRIAQRSAVSMIEEVLRLIYPQVGSGTQSLSEASTDIAQERERQRQHPPSTPGPVLE